ncbi:MAG: GNAT family N-acetyltransferase [Clostridia bacterium]|nr:GNAT family N-acetyltransferase [Clostridia bacterium]
MEIRFIKPEEAVDYHKISAASFIWNFNKDEDNEVNVPVIGAFNDDKLIAGIEVFDFKCNYCGNILNAVVLSGICSQPEYRRMGGIREIFNEIGKTAIENDITFGFLAPFSISFYEKFGYANLNRIFAIKVPFDKLRQIPKCTDVELYTGEQLDELCKLHNKCAMNENLMTLREDKKHFCEKPLEEADYTYIHRDSSGEADGYTRFKVNRPDEVRVEEIFALNPESLYGLIGFLRNYDGIAKNLIVRKQYQGSAFSCLADRIDDVTYEYNGGYAGRIYNLKKLLENNAYPTHYGKFSILSLDELEQNKGIFEVEYENGKAVVNHKSEGDYDIELTAAAAARLLLAGEGHNAQTAVYIDGVKLKTSADDFFRAFPYRATRFTDSLWSV